MELVGQRIDVLFKFVVNAENGKKDEVMRWCQGKVVSVHKDCNEPKVDVDWDGMPDVEGSEKGSNKDVILLPSKWKEDCQLAWRMDVGIENQL